MRKAIVIVHTILMGIIPLMTLGDPIIQILGGGGGGGVYVPPPNARYELWEGVDVAINALMRRGKIPSLDNVMKELEEMHHRNDVRLPYTWWHGTSQQKKAAFKDELSRAIIDFFKRHPELARHYDIAALIPQKPQPSDFKRRDDFVKAYSDFKMNEATDDIRKKYKGRIDGMNAYRSEMRREANKIWNDYLRNVPLNTKPSSSAGGANAKNTFTIARAPKTIAPQTIPVEVTNRPTDDVTVPIDEVKRNPITVKKDMTNATGNRRGVSTGGCSQQSAERGKWVLQNHFRTPHMQVLKLGNGTEMAFCAIPQGTFQMSNIGSGTHTVTITRPFWITRTFIRACELSALVPSAERDNALAEYTARFPQYDIVAGEMYKKNYREVCAVLNKRYADIIPSGYVFRLPSEAELEYATGIGSPVINTEHIAKNDCASVGVERKFGVCFVPRNTVNTWGLYAGFSEACHVDDNLPLGNMTFRRTKHGGHKFASPVHVPKLMRYSDGEKDPVRRGKGYYNLIRKGDKGRFFANGDWHTGLARIVIAPAF